MDRTEYFRKFPITVYNDTPSLNIMRRVDFNKNIRDLLSAFYDVELREGQRVETLAYDYYDDVDLDWLIYMTNDIQDPYHQVPLSSDDFEKTIRIKYGSVEKALKKTFVYRNNYYGTDESITEGAYEALPASRKKYWDPIIGRFGVMGYERAKRDIYSSTNRIISFSFATDASTPFTVGETVTADKDLATATVASCNTTYVTLKHVEGSWESYSSDFNVTGDESGEIISFSTDTYELLQHVIPEEEQIYFSKYSFYDYESDQNELKRQIYVIEADYADDVNKQLDNLMK